MSANNWDYCPRCKMNKAQEKVRAYDNLQSQYGVISATEWSDLKAEFEKTSWTIDDTLAEYFEYYINAEGEVYVGYKATCRNDRCDFEYEFVHQERINV